MSVSDPQGAASPNEQALQSDSSAQRASGEALMTTPRGLTARAAGNSGRSVGRPADLPATPAASLPHVEGTVTSASSQASPTPDPNPDPDPSTALLLRVEPVGPATDLLPTSPSSSAIASREVVDAVFRQLSSLWEKELLQATKESRSRHKRQVLGRSVGSESHTIFEAAAPESRPPASPSTLRLTNPSAGAFAPREGEDATASTPSSTLSWEREDATQLQES